MGQSESAGPVAVITGASRGLGRCFAHACAKRGYDLLLADLDGSSLERLASSLAEDWEVDARTIEGDLSDQDTRNRLLEAAASGPSVGLWINNAGISGKGPAHSMEAGRPAAIAALNVTALTDLAVRALPLLLESPRGRMINVSSLGAFYPIPYMAAYASSKSYILHFSLALNREMAGSTVTVSALCPGGMKTNELTIRDLEGQGLFGRWTIQEPEYVAEFALDASAKGRGVIIPGIWNRILRVLGSFLPKTVLARNLGRRWKKSLQSSGLMGRSSSLR